MPDLAGWIIIALSASGLASVVVAAFRPRRRKTWTELPGGFEHDREGRYRQGRTNPGD